MANEKAMRWGQKPDRPSVFYLTVVYKGSAPELVEVEGTPRAGSTSRFRPTAKDATEAATDRPWTTARCTQVVSDGNGPTLYYLE